LQRLACRVEKADNMSEFGSRFEEFTNVFENT